MSDRDHRKSRYQNTRKLLKFFTIDLHPYIHIHGFTLVLSTDTRAVATTIFIANLLYTSNIVATITDDKIFDECISAKTADYSTAFHYSDITAIAAAMTPQADKLRENIKISR